MPFGLWLAVFGLVSGSGAWAQDNVIPDHVDSFYTSIKASSCLLTEDTQSDMGGISECAGFGGHRLYLQVGEISNWLVVDDGRLQGFGLRPLSYVKGDKAEWRVDVKDGKATVFALIVRMKADKLDDDLPAEERLIVARVSPAQSCIVGSIQVTKKNSKTANAEARALADAQAKTAPCLDE
jgi:hypothetical protein